MKYQVVSANSMNFFDARNGLQEKVNEYLKKGWKLQGGVSISCHASYCILTQAMVFENDKPAKSNDVQVTML